MITGLDLRMLVNSSAITNPYATTNTATASRPAAVAVRSGVRSHLLGGGLRRGARIGRDLVRLGQVVTHFLFGLLGLLCLLRGRRAVCPGNNGGLRQAAAALVSQLKCTG